MKLNLLFLFLLSVFVFSCSQEDKDWKTAKETNTYEAYQKFVDKYPDTKHQQLEEALFAYITANPDQREVIYKDFRLRSKPDVNSTLIGKLNYGETVTILETSSDLDEITIDNYNANAYWYKIKRSDGTEGWIYGAGLKQIEDVYRACKLYLPIFADQANYNKVMEIYQTCDCNVWEEAKIQDNHEAYQLYLNDFESGIYSEEARILTLVLYDKNCYEFTDYYSNKRIEFTFKEDSVKGFIDGFVKATNSNFGGNFKGIRKGTTLYVDWTYTNSEQSQGQSENVKELVFKLTEDGLIDKTYDENTETYDNTEYMKVGCNYDE